MTRPFCWLLPANYVAKVLNGLRQLYKRSRRGSLKRLRINTIGDALEALKGRGRIRGISDVANRELKCKLIRAGFELK